MKNAGKKSAGTDIAALRYQKARIAHWNRVCGSKGNPKRIGAAYHELLYRYYRFVIPPGAKVLELGCGHGDLLAALNPSLGVGVDFSMEMIRAAFEKHPALSFILADACDVAFRNPFDFILLSDLVNDLWDAQAVFENVRHMCHPGTRLVLNFYNNLWRLPLAAVRRMGLGADVLEQNWFSPEDVFNLLTLTGFEVIKRAPAIVFPFNILLLSSLANRFLVRLAPFSLFAMTNIVVARPVQGLPVDPPKPSVSIVVPARNERGNIENIFMRVPDMGRSTEILFVEGDSTDGTYEEVGRMMRRYPRITSLLLKQSGKGKGNAVRLGFEHAGGDVLMILDADLTVAPEDLPRFYDVLVSGKGEFINGVRLVYPMENESMRFLNIVGNKLFSLAFSWLLGQPIKDTLCGTKVLWRRDYEKIASNRGYFGNFDPFGDFDLLFGAAKLNLKITELPIRYRSRIYGKTNIERWRHGWLLLKMVWFAARRIKFI